MSKRVNPFGDLGDFEPDSSKLKIDYQDIVDHVAAENGFTSRQPAKKAGALPGASVGIDERQSIQHKEILPSRRRMTGRSEQVNIKTTFATKKRLMEISVERDMPLGEVLELALIALEDDWKNKS